jgi:hypothetical protein
MDMVNSKLDEFVGKIAIEEEEDQEDLWWKEKEKVKWRNKNYLGDTHEKVKEDRSSKGYIWCYELLGEKGQDII